jgi:copper/silver efflux system protein
MFNRLVRYFLDNRLVTIVLLVAFLLFGIVYAPFNWKTGSLPRDPIPVDAIPDIGDNQQIVATEWMGRSPRDIQEQITYPLTSSLMGISDVKTIRSTSMFGMSFIYIIFDDKADFYQSRSRILEKLNSLPSGTLPPGVVPSLGPDATALGQVFWYTLEGRNPATGKPAGGWDPQELRTIQDFYVRYSLSSAPGVAEVASAGGFVREYQVDLDPAALKAYSVSVMDVMNAVSRSNLDIGAETIELNSVEYVIRGLGYIKNLNDLDLSVVAVRSNVPVRVKDVAVTSFGPATRRGGLDKGGSEAVGAVVVARFGSNPMEVINNVKDKIKEIGAGLPKKTLPDGSVSQVTIVPFYDRTGLIKETIGTLESALTHEILISIIVIIVLVLNLRASLIVAGLLPAGVLITFILMHFAGIEANIVALSGIAIAIGVMADIGIVDVENILRHLEMPENRGIRGKKLLEVIYLATTEVRSAVVTSIATTIISFLPVFAMEAAEGKLFRPLAFTKTFALVAAFILGIVVLPTMVYLVFNIRPDRKKIFKVLNWILIVSGLTIAVVWQLWPALFLTATGLNNLFSAKWFRGFQKITANVNISIAVLFAVWFLSKEWLPLGAHKSSMINFLFTGILISLILLALVLIVRYYESLIRWALKNKLIFLTIPLLTILSGVLIWRSTGKEFMPSLNEGSFLLMPTTMPYTGVEKNTEYIRILDRRLAAIPEVESAVGKWGRVNSALDPAPVQMFENTISYKPEYILDEDGHRLRFRTDRKGNFVLDASLIRKKIADEKKADTPAELFGSELETSSIREVLFNPVSRLPEIRAGNKLYIYDKNTFSPAPLRPGFDIAAYISANIHDFLIQERNGDYFRQWRPEIRKPDDIWNEIAGVTTLPGLTSAPKLQPIETRLVMLSTGMRASMGLKVYGPDVKSIETAGLELERELKNIPALKGPSVFYDRSAGAPYLEIRLKREAMARYGMSIAGVQEILQAAVGGMTLTTSVEGRERYPVRVRYGRELRENPDELKRILIPAANGVQIPLELIADIDYARGEQMIRSENTFLTGYVIFDKADNLSESEVVNEVRSCLDQKLAAGKLKLPEGVTYKFAGNYEQQLRASKKLALIVPLSLVMIFMLLYFQFRTITASLIHFSGVFVAFSGGFIMLWLYGQHWFLNFSIAGMNMRDLFQMHPINLSVAVWVGFIALFGIATNDGVIMGTYIHQVFEEKNPSTVEDVREAVILAGKKRVRPAMMTTAVAIIALLPVLSSTGKGAEIMIPMAIPAFGGMVIQVMTILVVPLFQSIWREWAVKRNLRIDRV